MPNDNDFSSDDQTDLMTKIKKIEEMLPLKNAIRRSCQELSRKLHCLAAALNSSMAANTGEDPNHNQHNLSPKKTLAELLDHNGFPAAMNSLCDGIDPFFKTALSEELYNEYQKNVVLTRDISDVGDFFRYVEERNH